MITFFYAFAPIKTQLSLKTRILFQRLSKGIWIQSYKANFPHAFKSELNKGIFFKYFPYRNFVQNIHFEFWHLYEMKVKLFVICHLYSVSFK